MADPPHQSDPDIPQPWQPRFGIGGLLLFTMVFCIMAAAASYLVRGIRSGDKSARLAFILLSVAAPLLLVVLVSGLRSAVQWWQRRRK